jgi:hypothetical protein
MDHFVPDKGFQILETFSEAPLEESYYDTPSLDLFRSGCWIVKRYNFETTTIVWKIKQTNGIYDFFQSREELLASIPFDGTRIDFARPYCRLRVNRYFLDDTHWVDVCYRQDMSEAYAPMGIDDEDVFYLVETFKPGNDHGRLLQKSLSKIGLYLSRSHPHLFSQKELQLALQVMGYNEFPTAIIPEWNESDDK